MKNELSPGASGFMAKLIIRLQFPVDQSSSKAEMVRLRCLLRVSFSAWWNLRKLSVALPPIPPMFFIGASKRGRNVEVRRVDRQDHPSKELPPSFGCKS